MKKLKKLLATVMVFALTVSNLVGLGTAPKSAQAAVKAAITRNYNGHTYAIYNSAKTQSEAKKEAESLGGHLVTITDANEMTFVNNMINSINSRNSYWIGLTRSNGQWKWMTGEKVTYTNWAKAEPSTSDLKTVCLFGNNCFNSKNAKYVGQWNDAPNGGETKYGDFYKLKNFGYIVEWDYINTLIDNGTQLIPNGYYTISPKCAPGRSIDICGASMDSGVQAYLWGSYDTTAQKFEFIYLGNGYYEIVNVGSGHALDVVGGSSENGTGIQQWYRNQTNAQKWFISQEADGYYSFAPAVNTGLRLDVYGAADYDSAALNTWYANGTNAQMFKITPTSVAPANESVYLNVPLYGQTTGYTCGSACTWMICNYRNTPVTNDQEVYSWANSNGQGTYVYRIAQAVNHFSSGAGYGYQLLSKSISVEDYYQTLKAALDNNHPVIVQGKMTSDYKSYWGYTSGGHYVLVSGIEKNFATGEYNVTINDPWSSKGKNNPQCITIPLSVLLAANKAHSCYIIK